MRSRSSSARRRSAASLSARAAAHCSRRTRSSSAAATTATTHAVMKPSCVHGAARSPSGGSHRYSQWETRTCPAHSPPSDHQAAFRCPATIALKQPTATATNTGPYG